MFSTLFVSGIEGLWQSRVGHNDYQIDKLPPRTAGAHAREHFVYPREILGVVSLAIVGMEPLMLPCVPPSGPALATLDITVSGVK